MPGRIQRRPDGAHQIKSSAIICSGVGSREMTVVLDGTGCRVLCSVCKTRVYYGVQHEYYKDAIIVSSAVWWRRRMSHAAFWQAEQGMQRSTT